jgi:nitrite reductase/ring-hydroxylating ferredoxin subunit
MQQLEAIAANVNDLQDGEMRQVSVGETEVLLTRLDGKFYAVGAHCTHYQAPLAEGILSENHVVCPWHNAYFNVTTGDQQEPPGLDSLAHYQVRVEGDKVFVSVPEQTSGVQTPSMASYNPDIDGRTFVILGAGAAGVHAAETLRVAGYQGRIVMVTCEDRLPYDRTWLSKDYFIGQVSKDQIPLRSPDFYKDHNIEVLFNKQAVRVDMAAKNITFKEDDSLTYDALLLTTGGKSRRLNLKA